MHGSSAAQGEQCLHALLQSVFFDDCIVTLVAKAFVFSSECTLAQ